MKKISMLFILCVAAEMPTCVARADAGCISSDIGSECNGNSDTYDQMVHQVDCTPFSGPIRILGICSSTNKEHDVGYSNISSQVLYHKVQTVIPGDEFEPIACWCRMIYPVISYWIFSGAQFDSTHECISKCATLCGELATGWQVESFVTPDDFKQVMFGISAPLSI